MASQNAAWFSPVFRTAYSLGAHLGRLMHLAAIILAASLIAPVQADEAGHKEQIKLFETGELICHQILNGATSDILGPQDYRSAVGDAEIGPATFCGCVGMNYIFSVVDISSRMEDAFSDTARIEIFATSVRDSFDTCLNTDSFLYAADFFESSYEAEPFFHEAAERFSESLEPGDCADGCQDGPVWEEENWDKLQCEYAIDGWTEPGNFDRDFVQEWLDDSGISADSLCTCASLLMEDSAEDYAAEYAETEDPELYWSYLSLSIDQCQMAMWQRPLL